MKLEPCLAWILEAGRKSSLKGLGKKKSNIISEAHMHSTEVSHSAYVYVCRHLSNVAFNYIHCQINKILFPMHQDQGN